MIFDLSQLSPRNSYKLLASTIVPRPIAWVVSLNESGDINAAPFSFFNLFCDDPPLICLGVMGRDGAYKHTSANILNRKEFVVNLVSEHLAEKMNLTSADFSDGMDKIALTGLTTATSHKVSVPRIVESPVALECVADDFLHQRGGRVIIVARVMAIHIDDDSMLDASKFYVDTKRLKLIARMHGSGEYAKTTDLFTMERPAR